MKKILLIIFLFLLASCESEKKDVVSIPVSVPERKLEVLYKTTDTYGSRMFSVPGGKENQVILRIKGGTKLKPVGLVYIGIKKSNKILVKKYLFKNKKRNLIQKSTVIKALNLILSFIK